MNILMIIAGILGYVFLARVFMNLMFTEKPGRYKRLMRFFDWECGEQDSQIISLLFPGTLVVMLVCLICKLPIKAADFATNPSNYKFRIRVERK